MNAEKTPIFILITGRIKELHLSRGEFANRCGYKNTAKCLRRLDALLVNDLHTGRELIGRLPAALDVPEAVVADAVQATIDHLVAMKEAAARAAFKPHGLLVCEHSSPTSIMMAVFTNAGQWLRVDFGEDDHPSTYVDKVMSAMHHRLDILGGTIPYFGAVIGFAVNYSFDLSVTYTLDGQVKDAQPAAQSLGIGELLIGKSSLMKVKR